MHSILCFHLLAPNSINRIRILVASEQIDPLRHLLPGAAQNRRRGEVRKEMAKAALEIADKTGEPPLEQQ